MPRLTVPTAATIATAPDAEGVVTVKIPALDGGRRSHGPCLGVPAGAAVAPGDGCVVVEDTDDQMWVLSWHPAT